MMMNLEDGSLVLIKAHGFENVISLGKNGFEPLNATCKMSCISSRWGCLFLSVLLQDFQTFHWLKVQCAFLLHVFWLSYTGRSQKIKGLNAQLRANQNRYVLLLNLEKDLARFTSRGMTLKEESLQVFKIKISKQSPKFLKLTWVLACLVFFLTITFLVEYYLNVWKSAHTLMWA